MPTKAQFKALREMTGLSQQNIADALDVNLRTVKSWENPARETYKVPDYAWDYLKKVDDTQAQQVSYMLGIVAKQVEEFGGDPALVPITYYRDQAMYYEFGRDDGPVGWPNAVARKVAYELGRRGIAYEFRYPQEGAVLAREN